jgi:hypothetical protein
MHLSPKSHLHNIKTNNLRKATQDIFADIQDRQQEAIPAKNVIDTMNKKSISLHTIIDD